MIRFLIKVKCDTFSTVPELRSRYSKLHRYTKLRRQVKQARTANKKWLLHWGCSFTIMDLVQYKLEYGILDNGIKLEYGIQMQATGIFTT